VPSISKMRYLVNMSARNFVSRGVRSLRLSVFGRFACRRLAVIMLLLDWFYCLKPFRIRRNLRFPTSSLLILRNYVSYQCKLIFFISQFAFSIDSWDFISRKRIVRRSRPLPSGRTT